MIILPATDIYGGKVVRLLHGDYAKMTVYDSDPLAVARRFEAAGAEWLHAVDLEGAKDGNMPNLEVIRRIAAGTKLKIEVGGGIRTQERAERCFDAGVERVIFGTAAVDDPETVRRCAAKYPGRVAVGADIRGGTVAVRGWTEDAPLGWREFLARMLDAGVRDFIVTDISRDGAMRGANAPLYREITSEYPAANIIASGGVSGYDDITTLSAIPGVWGVIVGKACYTGDIDVSRAVAAARAGGGNAD